MKISRLFVDFSFWINYNNYGKGSDDMDEKKKVFRSFTMITQISISVLVPIFLCVWIGIWLNWLLHTEVAFLVMLLLGIGAAFRNVYIVTRSFYAKDMKREHEQLEYIQRLKNYRKEHPEEYETDETDFERDVVRRGDLDIDSSVHSGHRDAQ